MLYVAGSFRHMGYVHSSERCGQLKSILRQPFNKWSAASRGHRWGGPNPISGRGGAQGEGGGCAPHQCLLELKTKPGFRTATTTIQAKGLDCVQVATVSAIPAASNKHVRDWAVHHSKPTSLVIHGRHCLPHANNRVCSSRNRGVKTAFFAATAATHAAAAGVRTGVSLNGVEALRRCKH